MEGRNATRIRPRLWTGAAMVALPAWLLGMLGYWAGLTKALPGVIVYGGGLALAGLSGIIIARLHDRSLVPLIESENAFQAKNNWDALVMDALPIAFFVMDCDLKWLHMNEAFAQLLPGQGAFTDRESRYGTKCAQSDEALDHELARTVQQLQNGRTDRLKKTFEWRGRRFEQQLSCLKDEQGGVVVYLGCLTERAAENDGREWAEAAAQVAANLKRLAEGDLRSDLQWDAAGPDAPEIETQFEPIRHSLSRLKSLLEELLADTKQFSQAAAAGDLHQRAAAAKYPGDFGLMIETLNQTLDSLLQPLEGIFGSLQRLAEGEAPAILDDVSPGCCGAAIAAVNRIATMFRTLRAEIGELAAAGRRGDLAFRCDIRQLQGGYGEIVQNVNLVLEAVTEPLGEASRVLEKMAVNDFTLTMNGAYQGRFGDLAEKINQVHARMLSVEDAFVKAADGDISRLTELREIGRRSANDRLVPSMVAMLTEVQNLLQEGNRLAEAALSGNLVVRGDESKLKGEYRRIIRGFNRTLDAVTAPIDEAARILQEVARGNLSQLMRGDYRGSYAAIKDSLNQTIEALNGILNEIREAADQVAAGARQVAGASQNLSQGATEQALSVEELTSSITQMAAQTRENAAHAGRADELALLAKQSAENGNTQMQTMVKAMSEINEASVSISKIIKAIDDIAFQTNILALNAAVEAARAGQHGKGFAVVAAEVRNLATRSADAAKETSALIESSIRKATAGMEVARETARALTAIVTEVAQAADLVGDIATASNEQANAITQINQGIEQVANVVQTNTATAEESAAASEELSNQATHLHMMVGQFELELAET